MPVKSIRGIREEKRILSYREAAKILYHFIKESKRIPYTRIEIGRVELRQGYGVLVSTSIGIKKVEGTKYRAKWKIVGDFKDAVELVIKKGVVILYTNEPWRKDNIAIIIYAD